MTSSRSEVVIGLDALRSVRATDFLPGLIVHKAVDCPPGMDYLTITHRATGLAVAPKLQPGDMKLAREVLEELAWDLPVDVILDSVSHQELSKKLMVKTNQERSKRQENRIAKDTGGKRQPASGARWGARRDVVLPRFKIEAKTTTRKSFQLDVRDLSFLKQQAYLEGKIGVYLVEISGKEDLCVLPKSEADDELLAGSTIQKMRGAGSSSFTLTAEMAVAAVHGTVFELELATGMYYCFCYERFLSLAKRGMDAA